MWALEGLSYEEIFHTQALIFILDILRLSGFWLILETGLSGKWLLGNTVLYFIYIQSELIQKIIYGAVHQALWEGENAVPALKKLS